MGVFDESKCDCCVCPMQCVLEQLVNREVGIITPTFQDVGTLNQVKDFIAFTDFGQFPISQISIAIIFDTINPINLIKSNKKNKGECACCEDPITNLAKSMIGETVDIDFIGDNFEDTRIIDVGEGIIVSIFNGEIYFFSSCKVTLISPSNQQQINESPRISNFQQLKKSPLVT
ncbi:hypothetical protein [Chengkuizengella axinellae]|uniref:Spore coat protein n=1 Tax=Chengkuizengella axinellae TaxID=3064388 RepID=A0ABT9ITI6_9BACL|nr:hypothetical protein [Chengkuizengella sp. 2205SS18-9]MDP5272666.1 hypothetical protein [Chengkuizengella sp. 2205SS18-9]